MALRLREGTPEAIRWLEDARTGPDKRRAGEALYRLGLAQGRLERWDQAAATMSRYVAEYPRGPYALSAGYQVGRLFHQAGRFARAAREHHRFLARRRPDHDKWHWFLGLVEFRGGRQAAAREVFDAIAPGENTLVGPKADYWAARSFLAEGRQADALRRLDGLARRAPLSYYGTLGAALAHTLDAARPAVPARPAGLPLPVVLPDLDPWIARLAGTPAGTRLQAIRLLIRAGEPGLADAQAVDLQDDPSIRALGAERDALARTLDLALERFGQRWRSDARRGLPWKGGLADVEADELRATYPLAWITLARAAGRLHGVSPWWLLAHMLQESRFKAQAASHAGALGPMQVLPRTGRLIAAQLGIPAGDFFAARLFEPGIALRHAAWYLAALRDEFGGNLLLAIAAYNGGPRRFAEHVLASRALPFDLLIEEIGAHESRNYVRKVADHLVRFATIYGDDAEREALIGASRRRRRCRCPAGDPVLNRVVTSARLPAPPRRRWGRLVLGLGLPGLLLGLFAGYWLLAHAYVEGRVVRRLEAALACRGWPWRAIGSPGTTGPA
ncbi:MAG: transglycosylase SLT domain-containing protein [bacterium]